MFSRSVSQNHQADQRDTSGCKPEDNKYNTKLGKPMQTAPNLHEGSVPATFT